jgi:hypothetical protein
MKHFYVSFVCGTNESTWDLNNPKDARSFGYTKVEWLAMSDTDKDNVLNFWIDQNLGTQWHEEECDD